MFDVEVVRQRVEAMLESAHEPRVKVLGTRYARLLDGAVVVDVVFHDGDDDVHLVRMDLTAFVEGAGGVDDAEVLASEVVSRVVNVGSNVSVGQRRSTLHYWQGA
ncbi:hypothetical protein [Kineococcus sp. SYSU DK002]|uniref:hypothetical protein n=1 Tax=Kineococcus sp. SYSU DK002 TaxID=3383123 RepID=UPI003D7EBE33